MNPNMPSSGRVDVLSVLSRSIAREYNPFEPDNQSLLHGHLIEARAAVAELIAADKDFDHAKARRIEADNRITRGDRTDEAFRLQASVNHAYDRANARRAAALARIGGRYDTPSGHDYGCVEHPPGSAQGCSCGAAP